MFQLSFLSLYNRPHEAMPSAYSSCTNVTPECPVSATTYGYRPNLAANTLFLAIFAICTILQLVLGIRYRLRAFLAVTTIGCALEAAGYVGRILMHINPWDNSGFELQIICIILAPSFLAAGIYLTLKHLVIQFGPEQSRLPPRLYTWIFCGCDAVSIVVQAGGGGLAATHNPKLLNIGNDLIIAGISFQVLTMLICWILAVDFAIRVARSKSSPLHGQSRGFLFYLVATIIAFFTIFVRCVYR